ncbi:hypothetical protein QTI17_17490 [Variovorax sp. J31P179]|uniref:hypothetical protein n=1 Tax=Variovorax sp. J31P179 TaxID=3053508 RepID=UPI002575EBD3|nr:hypothetical protein [Variovorax sp. J31P179]MDM0082388.1 hypothetical protein [Variovorax sp. J31P179]
MATGILPAQVLAAREAQRANVRPKTPAAADTHLKLAEVDDEVLRRFRTEALSTFLACENHARIKYSTRSMKEPIAAVTAAGDNWPIMSKPRIVAQMAALRAGDFAHEVP